MAGLPDTINENILSEFYGHLARLQSAGNPLEPVSIVSLLKSFLEKETYSIPKETEIASNTTSCQETSKPTKLCKAVASSNEHGDLPSSEASLTCSKLANSSSPTRGAETPTPRATADYGSFTIPDRNAIKRRDLAIMIDSFQHHKTIFIAIDFEGNASRNGDNCINQVGITTWFTGLFNPDKTPKTNTRNYLIHEYMLSRKQENGSLGPYFKARKAVKASNFGLENTSCYPLDIVAGLLNEMFAAFKEKEMRGGKSPVLVLHGGSEDLKNLAYMGVDITGIPVLDTQRLQSNIPICLGTCLYQHNIPCKNLHNAGNDSHYTMALLHSIGNRMVKRLGLREGEDVDGMHVNAMFESIGFMPQAGERAIEALYEGCFYGRPFGRCRKRYGDLV